VGWSQGSPERHVPMAEQCNRSAECRCQGMFPFVEEVAVVETPSMGYLQRARGRETRPSL